MAIAAQRDLVNSLKIETFKNVTIISKVHPLPSDLKQLFTKDALEKLTQNIFNPLSYYLVSIVDPAKASSFSWPLYDTKTERAYRNELSSFIADYSSKGLLSPVMSSYLVNPACYKVTVFVFQLSQLAVQKILQSKMKTEQQKRLYNEMFEKYKSHSVNYSFLHASEKINESMLQKLKIHLHKRKQYEKMAELFRNRITSMENKLSELKPQEYINNIVDSFIDDTLDEETKESILEIKNVNKPAKFFDACLEDMDIEMDELESEWDSTMTPIIKSAQKTMDLTKQLVERQTGEAEKSSYMIEYNHKTDEIDTKDLQDKVNSQQKYILKNLVKEGKLNFPNLVRSYVIAVSYIMKNKQIPDGVCQFNAYLQGHHDKYSEMVVTMKELIQRVMNAESRLEPSKLSFNTSVSMKDILEIPPLPDLSDLSMKRDPPIYLDTLTPLGAPKHRFNLRTNTAKFLKPLNQSLIYFQPPKDNFLKNFTSGQIYDRQNSNSNLHNLSMISQVHARSNETIAECSSGFTKQQIQRLLSTNKKSSSIKKHKFKLDRPSMIIKKGLFNVSSTSSNSSENGLFRCHSSPNLSEGKDKQLGKRLRKLSIMHEGSPTLLEVSGITTLEGKFTPEHSTEKSMAPTATPILPVMPKVVITPVKEVEEADLYKKIKNDSLESGKLAKDPLKKLIDTEVNTNDHTPKSKSKIPVKKSSSIEKIINRFKKVRASVIPQETKEVITEEKVNAGNVDIFTANKVLLPDLLSPSCSVFSIKSDEFLEQFCSDVDNSEVRKPRESLGTALGVDKTFLDQFDLVD